MAKPRNQAWLRDELILALDLYVREGRLPAAASVQDLSRVLRAIPIDAQMANNPRFRNDNAVLLKVSNFVAIDPASTTSGMARHGAGDAAVWEEFHDSPEDLREAAAAIRAAITSSQGAGALDVTDVDDLDEEAREGALLTRVHRSRERNARLVARKKDRVLARDGRLTCEACGFDFAAQYGDRGTGFIECHHTVPLHSLKPGTRTRLSDLALLCSNCHRMVHRRKQWLTVDALRSVLSAAVAEERRHG
jgi:5-methylcytosine-specific restriction enzyme A